MKRSQNGGHSSRYDQLGSVTYVPVSNWIQEQKGSKRVEITEIDDKWQITATLTVSGSCQCKWKVIACTDETLQLASLK